MLTVLLSNFADTMTASSFLKSSRAASSFGIHRIVLVDSLLEHGATKVHDEFNPHFSGAKV
jgi:hypothetical protein